MVSAWILISVISVNGVGTYKIDNVMNEQDCIQTAKQKWAAFYEIKANKKDLLTRCKDSKEIRRKEIKCDSVGHCAVRNY